MDSQSERQLFQDIGYIKAKVGDIDCLKDDVKDINKRVSSINLRVKWIFGWASGVAVMASFIVAFIKAKFLN